MDARLSSFPDKQVTTTGIKARFCGLLEAQIKDTDLTVAISVGKGLSVSPLGQEADHMQAVIDKINSLKPNSKPKNTVLLIGDTLQRYNFDRFTVASEKKSKHPRGQHLPIDPVNKSIVLSDEDLIKAFQALESDDVLKNIPPETEISPTVAAELFAAMFKAPSKEAGDRYKAKAQTLWQESKDIKSGIHAAEVVTKDWDQALNEYKIEKDWSFDGSPNYNLFEKKLNELEARYKDEAFKKNVDAAIVNISTKKQFVEAGEVLKKIAVSPLLSKNIKNKFLLKFIHSIPALDFNLVGHASCLKYIFEELAYMKCLPKKNYILYPGKLFKGLQEELQKTHAIVIQIAFEKRKPHLTSSLPRPLNDSTSLYLKVPVNQEKLIELEHDAKESLSSSSLESGDQKLGNELTSQSVMLLKLKEKVAASEVFQKKNSVPKVVGSDTAGIQSSRSAHSAQTSRERRASLESSSYSLFPQRRPPTPSTMALLQNFETVLLQKLLLIKINSVGDISGIMRIVESTQHDLHQLSLLIDNKNKGERNKIFEACYR